tara:strand:- start:324 stop:923 length:600 start_codon:yes stop_codon:yes gene_type:complete
MASTATPQGLRPVKRADGMPYAGATTEYLLDPAGEATNIFNGQVVTLGADGFVALAGGTGADITTNNLGGDTIGALGVFVGCSYTNDEGQTVHSNYYPSGKLNGKALVVDDPNVLFQAQLDGTGAQTIIGNITKFAAVQSTSTGSTVTGNSTSALDATTQTTVGAFQIVSHVSDPGDAFPDVLVRITNGAHMRTMNTGV